MPHDVGGRKAAALKQQSQHCNDYSNFMIVVVHVFSLFSGLVGKRSPCLNACRSEGKSRQKLEKDKLFAS